MKKIALILIVLLLLVPISYADLYRIANVRAVPSQVDRKTATLIEVPIQLQTVLLPEQRLGQEIISNQVECFSEDLVDSYVMKETSRTPIIIVKIMPDLEKDYTEITCKMTLTILQNNQTITEEKEFQKKIEYYNNPLGEIDTNIQEKINGINEQIHDFEKYVAQFERTSRTLGTVADYAQTAAMGDAINTGIIGGLWAVAAVLDQIAYTKPAAKFIWGTIAKALHVGHTFVLFFTWNPGQGPRGASSIVSSFTKTLTIMQSCQLCDYSNSYTALIDQAAGKKIFTLDDKQGKPTTISQFFVYEWEPYKSIHVAQACLCLPAISYNLQKEKQIKCIYRNCIEQNAELGLPLSECDKTLKQQQCLYVDGAAWKISGGNSIATVFSELINHIFRHIGTIQRSLLWQFYCDYDLGILKQNAYPEAFGKFGVLEDWAVPMCSVLAGMQMLEETDFFKGNKYKWGQYSGKLQGEDYC